MLTSFSKTIDCPSTWPLFPLPSFRMTLRATGHGQKNENLAKVRSFSLVIFPCTRKPNRMLTFFSSNCSLQSLYILNEVTVDFTARCSEDQVREPSLQASLPLQNTRGFSACGPLQDGVGPPAVSLAVFTSLFCSWWPYCTLHEKITQIIR